MTVIVAFVKVKKYPYRITKSVCRSLSIHRLARIILSSGLNFWPEKPIHVESSGFKMALKTATHIHWKLQETARRRRSPRN